MDSKVLYAAFDPISYAENKTFSIGSAFTSSTIMTGMSQVMRRSVQKTTSEFVNNVVFDVPFTNGEFIPTYQVIDSGFSFTSYFETNLNSGLGYINIVYSQANLVQEVKFVRMTLFSLLWVIGGFLSMITWLTNYWLANYQSFTMDKSMMKKIYSEKRAKTVAPLDKAGLSEKQSNLEETIKNREPFRYTFC